MTQFSDFHTGWSIEDMELSELSKEIEHLPEKKKDYLSSY